MAFEAAKLELRQLDKVRQRVTEWHTGEITTIATLRCRTCGEPVHFKRNGHIPPCPKCHATVYERIKGKKPAGVSTPDYKETRVARRAEFRTYSTAFTSGFKLRAENDWSAPAAATAVCRATRLAGAAMVSIGKCSYIRTGAIPKSRPSNADSVPLHMPPIIPSIPRPRLDEPDQLPPCRTTSTSSSRPARQIRRVTRSPIR